MKRLKLTSLIWREENGYVSKCPELGVASAGDSVEEALANLKEAVELYLDNAYELGILNDLQVTLEAEKFASSFEVETRW
ncbi:MAG: type II toxin-antitoxin system HicB family antitoxin [Peptococcaceae bacterium]|nr:type II toxin-antitoxin system HicB family antitoxin [Peptococcaceae bacterium]